MKVIAVIRSLHYETTNLIENKSIESSDILTIGPRTYIHMNIKESSDMSCENGINLWSRNPISIKVLWI